MNSAAATIGSRLASIVGASHVIEETAELARYAASGKIPAAAAQPGSAEEAAEVVKFAAAENLAIVPAGARTKLAMGMPPRQYDLALDVTRLDRVVAYDPGDLTLSVEAGIPLEKLAGVLAEHRQFLPLAPPFWNRSTAGGTIASGLDSPFRRFYGTARDFVLGMEFITGEGTAVRSGGRVVKNVAGYDLHKLMIGSLGTLGVITRINFRTFPQPAPFRMLATWFDGAGGAVRMRDRVARSPLAPITLDILSPGAGALLSGDEIARAGGEVKVGANTPLGSPFSASHWTLVTIFAGNETVLARTERELRHTAEGSEAVDALVLDGKTGAGALLHEVRDFVPIALEAFPAATLVKIGVPPSRMREIFEIAASATEPEKLPWAALARGCGVIYLALLPREANEEMRHGTLRAADRILAECDARGGNASIPWCPAEWRRELKAWPLDRGDVAQMEKLKKVFDPRGILSPGRFVGGL